MPGIYDLSPQGYTPGIAPTDRAAILAVLQHVPHAILLHEEGRIVFANPALCRLLGMEPGALDGVPLSSLLRSEDAPAARALAQESDLPVEVPLARRDGAPVWVQARAARVHVDGRGIGLVSLGDVGARREAEEGRRALADLLRRQEEQLEHSTRLAELGEMAASISHELNQPLTGIRNYARNAYYMLEQKPGAEAEVKNNLRLISEQVDRAAKIINQMRELTRRTDGGFSVLDVNSVVRESVQFILPQMKLSEVDVTLALGEPLAPIWGDRIRLEQVFLNLLSNARHAMADTAVRRLTIRTRRDPGAAAVVVEVVDTGRGFTPDQGSQLFQPFYTTRKGGHGLGLSISRAIVQDHKGSIEAIGAPGGGATFTLRFPAVQRGTAPAGGGG